MSAIEDSDYVPFHHEWKIPNYKEIFLMSKPASFITSQPIRAGKIAVLSLVIFPRGVKEVKIPHIEVYIKLVSINVDKVSPAISYLYGFQNSCFEVIARKFANSTRVAIGEACINDSNVWIAADAPMKLEDCIQKDESVMFILKGVLSCKLKSSQHLKTSSSKMEVNSIDEILIATSFSADAQDENFGGIVIEKGAKGDTKCFSQLVMEYPKWSTEMRSEDRKIVFTADMFGLNLYFSTESATLINNQNITSLLLASDICSNEKIKSKCFKYIKQQGPDIFTSRNWKLLRDYVPELHREAVMLQFKDHGVGTRGHSTTALSNGEVLEIHTTTDSAVCWECVNLNGARYGTLLAVVVALCTWAVFSGHQSQK